MSRDISVRLLVACGRGHLRLAHVELLVQMRELPPRVLQEEPAVERESGGENIQEENDDGHKNDRTVFAEEDALIGRHELQLVEQPEAVSKQKSNRQDEGVGDHGFVSR